MGTLRTINSGFNWEVSLLNGDPAPYVMIHIVKISTSQEVANCTTGQNGCCSYPVVLEQDTLYNANSECMSTPGVEFRACSEAIILLK